jgi:hypothetical protein
MLRLELPGAHTLEQLTIFLDRPLPVGAVPAGPCERAAVFPDLVGGQVADVRLALVDQLQGVLV